MSEKEPTFAQRTIFEAGYEVIEKGDMDFQRFKAIVAELSPEERLRFHHLFKTLSAVTGPNSSFELSPEIKTQLDRAEEIFDLDYMGPEQIEEAWGFQPEQIPSLPESFTPERLKRAKKLGMMLMLHVDKTPGDTPMTMESMQCEFDDRQRIPYRMEEYDSDDFYDQDTSRFGWKLVSKKMLPDSRFKNGVQQLELIADYLQNTHFKGMELPMDYKTAIDEFEAKKDEIQKLLESDINSTDAAKMIEALTLSKLACGLPVEYMQTFETYYQNRTKNREEFLLYETQFQTMRRSNNGGLVSFYCPHAYGVSANDKKPEKGNLPSGIFLMLAS